MIINYYFLTENKQYFFFLHNVMKCKDGRMSHVAHVGLELSHTLVLRSVQDHREVGQVLLGFNWIAHLF